MGLAGYHGNLWKVPLVPRRENQEAFLALVQHVWRNTISGVFDLPQVEIVLLPPTHTKFRNFQSAKFELAAPWALCQSVE